MGKWIYFATTEKPQRIVTWDSSKVYSIIDYNYTDTFHRETYFPDGLDSNSFFRLNDELEKIDIKQLNLFKAQDDTAGLRIYNWFDGVFYLEGKRFVQFNPEIMHEFSSLQLLKSQVYEKLCSVKKMKFEVSWYSQDKQDYVKEVYDRNGNKESQIFQFFTKSPFSIYRLTKQRNGIVIEERLYENGNNTMYYIKEYGGNGKIIREGKIENNTKDGKWKYYSTDGSLTKTEFYSKGVLKKSKEY